MVVIMKPVNYKLLFWLVLVIALFEGLWIFYSGNLENKISMGTYSFSDSVDGLVTAEGSWISTTQLAFPLSTAYIECWKEFGHCWIADATIMDFEENSLPSPFSKLFKDNFLSVGLNLKEIAVWNDDFIETKPSVPLMGCVEESYRLDRRNKVVTYTRKTIKTTDTCEGVLKEPIVSKLGDGLERLRIYKRLNK